jgi:hypothetical protein
MEFWKIEKLAISLVNNELTEEIKLKYYLSLLYLQLLCAGIPAYLWGSKLDNLGVLSYFLGGIVATIYIIKINEVNKKIDDKNIIERLAVLSFPAFLQSIVLYWILYFTVVSIYTALKIEIFLYVFRLLGFPFYYWFGFELIRKALVKRKA